MSDKIFSPRIYLEVQSILFRFGIPSTLVTQQHFGTTLLFEPVSTKINIDIQEWLPIIPAKNVSIAQRMANFSLTCRLSNEETLLVKIDRDIHETCSKGETKVEVEVPQPMLTNAEGCSRIIGSVVVKGYFLTMYANKFKIILPPPCKISTE